MSWLFALTFVVSFTYTVVDLTRRIGRRLDRRQEVDRWHQAHRR